MNVHHDRKVAKWLNSIADMKLSRLKQKLERESGDKDMWVQRYNAITISIATSIKSLNKQKRKAFIGALASMDAKAIELVSRKNPIEWTDTAPGFPDDPKRFREQLGYVFMQGFNGFPRYPCQSKSKNG